MAGLGGFDLSFGGISPIGTVAAALGTVAMDGDEYVRCNTCGYGGCDVRVSGCGCTLHTRCLALNPLGPLANCPQCHKPTTGLYLFPMSFREIDEIHRSSTALSPSSKPRGRKRKGPDSIEEKAVYVSEKRTGRWSTEEMTYCDKLIEKFVAGEIPVAEGVKLNEFLGNMLKSKQSRLTKKMKNAKLSSKTFQRKKGYLDSVPAREFSELEESFFQSVIEPRERAEIKFHMQKEWREQFSRVCAAVGQSLDADGWLSSVEEMDRRSSQAREAARMAKRRRMMGVALRTDLRNPDQGVFIEKSEEIARAGDSPSGFDDMEEEVLNLLAQDSSKSLSLAMEMNGKSSLLHSAPFLAKVIAYLQRHNVPFEHVDLWVPSFVPNENDASGDQTTCRLCYAGSASVEKLVVEDGKTVRDLSQEEQFNLFAFGDYSQRFSFDVGCGLPGRVYESGCPTWEQSVHKAPHSQFERCGGALQWGIRTVLGIPVASPNVGRIVVTVYSCFDRVKDEDLMTRLSEEFTRLMPSPKWKLVVDIGEVEDAAVAAATAGATAMATSQDQDVKEHADTSLVPTASSSALAAPERDPRIDDVVALLGEFMPSDPNSHLAPYLAGFMSLRLLLLRTTRTPEEEEVVKPILDSFTSYSTGGRERSDIAVMIARDYMFLSQQRAQQQQLQQHLLQQSASLPAQQQPPPNAAHQGVPNPGLSLFCPPSISSNIQIQNSRALTPIPIQGSSDNMSVVSN